MELGYQLSLSGAFDSAVEAYQAAARTNEGDVRAMTGVVYCQVWNEARSKQTPSKRKNKNKKPKLAIIMHANTTRNEKQQTKRTGERENKKTTNNETTEQQNSKT